MKTKFAEKFAEKFTGINSWRLGRNLRRRLARELNQLPEFTHGDDEAAEAVSVACRFIKLNPPQETETLEQYRLRIKISILDFVDWKEILRIVGPKIWAWLGEKLIDLIIDQIENS